MTKAFRGNAAHIRADLAAQGMKYGITIGRRAPMHKMHMDCILEIADAGLTPIILIGSTNGPQSRYYNPLKNPLTVAQQKAQMTWLFPGVDIDRYVITLDDVGDDELWCDNLHTAISHAGLAGKSVVHFRSKNADAGVAGAIKPLSSYSEGFIKRGLPVWESFNRDKADDAINASELRILHLEHLTAAERQLFAAPDYIIQLAKEARARNASKAELDAHHIPITMLDLTFDRLQKEAGIDTATIINAAKKQGELTYASLIQSTEAAITQLHRAPRLRS